MVSLVNYNIVVIYCDITPTYTLQWKFFNIYNEIEYPVNNVDILITIAMKISKMEFSCSVVN